MQNAGSFCLRHTPCLSLSWSRVQRHSVLLFLLISEAGDRHCVQGYGVDHISGIVKEMLGELGRLRREREEGKDRKDGGGDGGGRERWRG